MLVLPALPRLLLDEVPDEPAPFRCRADPPDAPAPPDFVTILSENVKKTIVAARLHTFEAHYFWTA